MTPRPPLFITISIIVFIITFVFAMFTQDCLFFSTLIYWMTNILGILVTFIISSLEELIDIKKYNLLNESEKNYYNYLKSISYFQRLRQSALDKQDDIVENKIIIDNGFDGIMELDNALPMWWVSLFYFGIIFCISYMFLFFTTETFANPQHELQLAIIEAQKQQENYSSTIIQPTLETVKLNPDYVEEGKELFNVSCSSCHQEGGIGGIGPNLTDDYWINVQQKNLIQNVFDLVWNGSQNNASMRGFGIGGELTGVQIEKIANYVYYINQVEKNQTKGASPQGEKILWE